MNCTPAPEHTRDQRWMERMDPVIGHGWWQGEIEAHARRVTAYDLLDAMCDDAVALDAAIVAGDAEAIGRIALARRMKYAEQLAEQEHGFTQHHQPKVYPAARCS